MSGAREPQARSGVRNDETRRVPAELLAAIRRGDADAFEAVAREHAPALFRVAMGLTRNREAAEDLVQETLVKALPKLRGFEGRAKISTYLFRALTNLWKNRLRSKSRSPLIAWIRGKSEEDDDGMELDPPDLEPLPSQRMESDERATEVRAAVDRLEPTRKLTLLLREVEEMSYEQIASTTGVPVGTVRSRLARAREDLRRILEK